MIEEGFVPLSQYEELKQQIAELQQKSDSYYDENQQLKDVLKKMDVGMTPASKLQLKQEITIRIEDPKIIDDLGCMILSKRRPKSLTIKGSGGIVTEIKDG